MSPLIDSHCHLDHYQDPELTEVLHRAREAGLAGLVTIGTRLSRAGEQLALAGRSTPALKIWCTVGTHPDHVLEEPPADAERLAELARHPEVIGIGESGLDYLRTAGEGRGAQRESFRTHLRAARLADLPLIIHAREADQDVIEILEAEHAAGGPFRFVLHCFSSGADLAHRAIRLGGSISFSGILTFGKSDPLRVIARDIPLDRLLVETDAPYLAPAPHRGRRNEPAFVRHTLERLAGLKQLQADTLSVITTENFHRLFSKAR